MSTHPGPPAAARPGDTAGTLRLLAYLGLAIILLVLDHRGGWMRQARAQAQLQGPQQMRACCRWTALLRPRPSQIFYR